MAPVWRNIYGEAVLKPSQEEVVAAIREYKTYIKAASALAISYSQLRYLRVKVYKIERDEASDEVLQQAVEDFYKTTVPSSGERNFEGFLIGRNLKVRRKRQRAFRIAYSNEYHNYRRYRRDKIARRIYFVPGVHFMWHIDGYVCHYNINILL